MPDLVMKAIRREYRKQEQEVQTVEIDLETDEGKKFASEQVIKNIKAMFGNRVVDKRK